MCFMEGSFAYLRHSAPRSPATRTTHARDTDKDPGGRLWEADARSGSRMDYLVGVLTPLTTLGNQLSSVKEKRTRFLPSWGWGDTSVS